MKKYQYKVQGVDYDVEIEEVEGNIAKVNVNGIPFEVELKQPINPTSSLNKVKVEAPKPVAKAPAAAPAAAPAPTPAPAGAGTAIKSPLPGTITDVKVNVGFHRREARRLRHGGLRTANHRIMRVECLAFRD